MGRAGSQGTPLTTQHGLSKDRAFGACQGLFWPFYTGFSERAGSVKRPRVKRTVS